MNRLSKDRFGNADVIYFNAIVSNDSRYSIRCEFDQTRGSTIVDKASDYYMTVARFELPGYFLPALIMPIQEGQDDINLSEYSVTLEYNGETVVQYLEYESVTLGVNPPTTPGDNSNEYYNVYSYQQLVSILNTAFSNAFDQFTDTPALAVAPQMVYTSSTKLFTLVVQSDYYADSDDDAIKIYMNYQLYPLFEGFHVEEYVGSDGDNTEDNKDFRFVIAQTTTNEIDADYYYITQNYISTPNWNPFKRILFIADGMPVQSELIPSNDDAYENVLIDFRPDESSSQDIRSVYQYNPYFYRLINLVSNSEIRRVAFRIFWEDQDNNLYPLRIPYRQNLSVKFAFIKKSSL